MNRELFLQARGLYARKDYNGALAAYTQCLQDTSSPLVPGEMGQLYHQIGNCLIKLRNPNEAIQSYLLATSDEAYDAFGSVNCNLGMAFAALQDYENAIKYFEVAVSDSRYDAPYKAYTGMGSALLKLGKSAEAGVAFREAALDEKNPDPTKALLNLGICFMALGRAQDAVASYESALQFDMNHDTRNKLNANLGQAYVADGQMQKATSAFEEAIADKTYYLSDSASVDYQRAIAAISQGASDVTRAMTPVSSVDMSGLDIGSDGMMMYPEQESYGVDSQDQYYYTDPYAQEAYSGMPVEQDRFFNQSEEELEKWSKGLAKQDRKRRNVGLKIFLTFVVLLVIALGAAVFLYTQGYGYPTQETVVEELFTDPASASSSVFSSGVDAESIVEMTNIVVQDSNMVIDGVDRSMSDSTVYVTASTPEGGSVQYVVSLVRDVVGWKVSQVELFFPSQG